MARTTPTKVKEVTGSTLADSAIDPFITAASCIIDQIEPCTLGRGISNDCLIEAETFLAAHLLTSSNVGQGSAAKESEKFEAYSVSWAKSKITGQGVLSTPYGMTANALTGGCLQEVDQKKVEIGFFGGAG